MILEVINILNKIYLKFKFFLKQYKFLKVLHSYIIKLITFYKKKIYLIIFKSHEYKKFLKDKREFLSKGGKIDEIREALNDFEDNAGIAKGHYFHQDLLVANMVYKNSPVKHLDIGSRIDGFVAHVAAFREIEVLDIRKLNPIVHSNIKFKQKDLMQNFSESLAYDSISCLHALEHFGLGRYNDPIRPDGHLMGYENIIKLLQINGLLYISFPIGVKKVIFNQRRVFHYKEILMWSNQVRIERFDYVDDEGNLILDTDIDNAKNVNYGCGIYTLKKY